MRAQRATILSIVGRARYNNKGISFSGDFVGSAIEWYARFSGRSYPLTFTGLKKNKHLSHRVNVPPIEMNSEAAPVKTVIRAAFCSYKIPQSPLKPYRKDT